MKECFVNILAPIPALILFVFLMYVIQFLGIFHKPKNNYGGSA